MVGAPFVPNSCQPVSHELSASVNVLLSCTSIIVLEAHRFPYHLSSKETRMRVNKWLLPLLLILSSAAFSQEKPAQQGLGQWDLPKLEHFDVSLLDAQLNPCDNF